MTLSEEDKLTIRKYALQNAVKYSQPPKTGAVMGKVMSESPHLRPMAKEVKPLVEEVLNEVSDGTPDVWKEELNKIAPELLDDLYTKKEPTKGLKPLDVEEGEEVVMRFAPNPNGPPTLGSTRGIVVNSEYVKKYNGTFIIRFDDTDPQTKRPMMEAYEWYIEDCKWLGAEPEKVVYASDKIPVYYEYAENLIEMGNAYVCFCKGDEFKKYKDNKKACPHRDQSPEDNLYYWNNMLNGEYGEKEAVLRIKTDIQHKDPALRDFGAFRIIKTNHPRPEVDGKYVVWPLLDFEGAIEDHECGVNHIIRGKDLRDSERRQRYIYEYFGWEYPKTTHWGRVKIHEFGKFSTSSIAKSIENGEYLGWDDPALPTIRALRRRGIQSEAIRKFMIDMGVGETDISISLESLYAENRKLVDSSANRYFFVWNPVELEITGVEPRNVKLSLHPKEKRGHRELEVGSKLYVCQEDIDNINTGDKLRLKDLYNIEITSLNPFKARYLDDSVERIKKENLPIIHWIPLNGVAVKVMAPDGQYEGFGEHGIADEVDSVVQFERFGFCRIDSADDKIIAFFAHK
jgi:glutamyl-tRNA synthetase